MSEEKIIIGIDPGSINMGYGILSLLKGQVKYKTHGVIAHKNLGPNERLGFIRTELDRLIAEHKPQMASIEKVFLGKNPQSIFRLGLARGVAISCLSYRQIQIHEYSPTQMKKIITGSGHSSKAEIMRSVKMLLNIKIPLTADAADALGLAYVHARNYAVESRLSNMVRV